MPDRLVLEGVTFTPERIPVLRGINLTVEKGTVVVIGGRSGCGKSTLLELCAGLKKPDRGRVMWDGVDLAGMSRTDLLNARQRIGYVFQHHALIANYSIFENVALPLRIKGIYSEREIQSRVQAVLEEVALFDVDRCFPEALSAGQLRSASIARALVTDPDMLFLDEPVSGQDPRTAAGIKGVLVSRQQQRPQTIISVSHDPELWAPLTCRTIILANGRLGPEESDGHHDVPAEVE